MGQSSSAENLSEPHSVHHPRKFPNNLLMLGTYSGYLATSHFKDWHRIDLTSDEKDDEENTFSMIGTLVKKVVSGSSSGNNAMIEDYVMDEDHVPNVSLLSEFDELSIPIVEVVSSGSCQLFIDAERNLKLYRTSKYETHDFRMKKCSILERNGLDKRNLIMIGSSQSCFYFVFKDMRIVVFDHEKNTVQLVDFCKENGKEIIEISSNCTGVSTYILTRKQDEYELLVERDGLIGVAEIGDLVGKLNNIRFISKFAIVTNDNKIYILGMIFFNHQGFKYIESSFETKSEIIQVECGFDHCVVLTQDGKVYAMGFNQYYQCGMQPGISNIIREFVEIIPPTKYHNRVLRIGCGSIYTALLTETHILVVGKFTGNSRITCKNRIVKAQDKTSWLVSKNSFGINDIYCAGWHLCAIETVQVKKEYLFAKLVKNPQWFSDVEIITSWDDL